MPVRRVQPQDTPGGYGYEGSRSSGGYVPSASGGFGPDAAEIQRRGSSSFESLRQQIQDADEEQRKSEPDTHEANAIDSVMHGLYQIGEGIAAGPQFVRDLSESDNPVAQGVGFVTSLPFGTFGALPQGVAQGYEFAFGRGVADDTDEVERLSGPQQAASGVNSAINLLGTFAGGSGSMLRGGARAARAGIGRLTGNVAESAGRAAASEVAEATSRGLLRTVAGEAAEEAGEEFVQSLADDARFETADEGSLGRAAQSAALGAVGGAIMSGAGYGLNKLAARITGADQQQQSAAQPTKSDVTDADKRQQAYGGGQRPPQYLSDAAREVMAERSEGRSANWPGSNSTLVMPYDNSFNVRQSKIGTNEIRNIFYAPDNGKSAEVISRSLGMSVDDAQTMFSADDWEDRLESRVNDMAAAGTPMKMYWARNPATKGRQPIETDVVGVWRGSGLMLHPTVVPYVGADTDGDRMFTTFNSEGTDNAVYVTDLLVDPETGALALDGEAWMRAGISPRASRAAIRKALTSALNAQTRTYTDRNGNQVQENALAGRSRLVGDLVDTIRRGLTSPDRKAGYEQVARAFIQLRDNLSESEGFDGGVAIADAMYNLAHDQESSFVNAVDNVIRANSPAPEFGSATKNAPDEKAPGIPSQGKLPSKPSVAQMLSDLNMITYAINQEQNSPFRQNGQMGMRGKALPTYIDGAIKALGNLWTRWTNTGKFENVIVACLNESYQGGSVENSIDSILRGYVVSRSIAESGVAGQKVRTREQFEEFLRKFVEVKNESVNMGNEARDILTARGIQTDPMSMHLNEMTYSENMLESADAAYEFVRIMRNIPFGSVFDESLLPSELQGRTFGELIDFANDGASRYDRSILRSSMGEYVNDQFNLMRDAQSKNVSIVTNTMVNELGDISVRLQEVARHMENGRLDMRYAIEAKFLLDAVSNIVGPEAMFDAGMVDYTTFLASEWGQELASGDQKRATRAVLSIAYTGQYRNVVRDLRATQADTAQRNAVLFRLKEMAKIDDVHAAICMQLIDSDDGYSSLLDTVTDMGVSYDALVNSFKTEVMGFDTGDNSLVLSAMRNKVSEFDMTDINARRRKVTRYLNAGRMACVKQNEADLNVLKDRVRDTPEHLFDAAMEELVQQAPMDMDMDAAAMMVYDAMFFGNESLEKATIENAAQQRANSVEIMRWGGPMAVTEQMVDAKIGRVSMQSFVSNRYLFTSVLSGRIEGVWVYDPNRPSLMAKWVTRDEIFSSVSSGYDSRRGPTKNDWLNLFDASPQLLSMLAPQKVVTSIADGRAIATTGVETPLVEYVTKYIADSQSIGPEDAVSARFYANAKRNVRNRLAQIPGLLSKIVTTIDNVDEITDPRILKARIRQRMDEIVDYAIYRSLMVSGGETEVDASQAMAADALDKFADDIGVLVNTSVDFSAMMSLQIGAEQGALRAMRSKVAEMVLAHIVGERTGSIVVPTSPTSYESVVGVDAEAVASDAKRTLDGCLEMYLIMCETAGEDAFDHTFSVDGDARANLEAAVDQSDLDDAAKAQLKSEISHPSQMLRSYIAQSAKSDRVLTMADLNPAIDGNDPASLAADTEAKVVSMLNGSANHDMVTDELRARVREAVTGVDANGDRVKDLSGMRRKLVLDVNSLMMRHIINIINVSTGSRGNENALSLYMKTSETEREILAMARDEIGKLVGPNTTPRDLNWNGTPKMPVSRFLNSRTQAIVTKLDSTDVPAGSVPLSTGVNGIKYHEDVAFGMLPRDKVCNEPPRPLGASDLSEFEINHRGHSLSDVHIARPLVNGEPLRYDQVQPGSALDQVASSFSYDVSQQGQQWVVGVLTPEEIAVVTSGSFPYQVYVFSPEDCENGMCCAHQHAEHDAAADGYLSLSNIVNRINQHAQEAMNIKMKKRPGMLDVVGGNRDFCKVMPREVAVSSDANGNVSRQTASTVIRGFLDARRDLEDEITLFLASDEMKGLGFGRQQARVLANAIVLGERMTFVDADGSTFSVIAGKTSIDNEAAMTAFVQSVIADHPVARLVSAIPYESTLGESAMRSMRHVMDSNPQDLTNEQFQEEFYRGMSDLSLMSGELCTADILLAVEPVGTARPDFVAASTNPSLVNSLNDIMSDVNAHSLIRGGDRDVTHVITEDEGKRIDRFNNEFPTSRGSIESSRRVTIGHVFSTPGFVDSDQTITRKSKNPQKAMLSIVSTEATRSGGISDVDRYHVPYNGAALALDPEAVYEAVQWSRKTGQPVLVPRVIISSYGIPKARIYLSGATKATMSVQGKEFDLVEINPHAYDDAIGVHRDRMTSYNQDMPDDVFVVMEATPGMSMTDAGSYYNAESVGMVVSERNTIERMTVASVTGGNVKGFTRLATPDEVGAMVSANGDRSMVNLDAMRRSGMSKERIDEELAKYESWFSSSNGGSTTKTDVSSGEIVTFLATSTVGGPVILTPVLTSQSGPDVQYRNVRVTKSGDDVFVAYDARVSLGNNLSGNGKPRLYAHKIALDSISFKSMGIPLDPGKFSVVNDGDMPVVRCSINGTKKTIDVVIDNFAIGSRMADQSVLSPSESMYWYSHRVVPVNGFLEDAGNGRLRLKEAIRRNIIEDPQRWRPEVMRSLLLGNGDLAVQHRVATGELRLSDDDFENEVLKAVYVNCEAAGVSPNDILASFALTENELESLLSNNGEDVNSFGDIAPRSEPNVRGVQSAMVVGGFNEDWRNCLYHWIDPGLVPRDRASDAADGSTVFSADGKMYVDMGVDSSGNPVMAKVTAFVGPVYDLGKTNQEGTPSDTAKRGNQMRSSQAMDNGLIGTDRDFFIRSFAIQTGRTDVFDAMRGGPSNQEIEDSRTAGYRIDPDEMRMLNTTLFDSANQRRYREKLFDAGKVYERFYAVEDKTNGRMITSVQELEKIPEVRSAVDDLNHALSSNDKKCNLSMDAVNMLVVTSASDLILDNGNNSIPLGQYVQFIRDMAENVRSDKSGIPIVNRVNKRTKTERIATAVLPRELARLVYDQSPVLQQRFQTFPEFKEAMFKENQRTLELIETCRNEGKKRALYRLNDWLLINWGEEPNSGHVYGETYLSDMIMSEDPVLQAMSGVMFSKEQVQWMRDMSKLMTERIAAQARHNDLGTDVRYDTTAARAGFISRYNRRQYGILSKALRTASELSRFLAIMDPIISVANVTDRVINQGTTDAVMRWCMTHGVGPYKSNFVPDQDAVRMGATSSDAAKVFEAIRLASYDGEEAYLMSNIRGMDDINSFLADRKEAMRSQRLLFIPRRFVDKVFEFAGGGTFMQSTQIRIWFNQFARIISSNEFNQELNGQTNPLLVRPGGKGAPTLLELQWSQSPGMFLAYVFSDKNNPYYTAARQALQLPRRCEKTQANILYSLLQAAAKRWPVFEFFTTTFVSKFMLYSTNTIGSVLNIFAPMSAANYVLTDFASRFDKDGAWGFNEQQMYINLREALVVDALHMAPAVIAMILGMIPGLVEPPEDEDKRGNPDEWLIMGKRIGDDWLLSDTLGLAMPLVCFFSSLRTGDVRFDLLWNGLVQTCYNNPMLRAGSVIGMFADPESAFDDFEEQFESDQETYANAPGGSPDMATWVAGRLASSSVSWASQFVTPSFVRNLLTGSPAVPYEVAYRYVEATDERGNVIMDPDTGQPQYQETSYLDAQIRRVTRNQPVMGLFADLWSGAWISGNTGYTAWEMPRTVYYDDAQLECMQALSVNDENGNPLPVDQQQERVMAVLAVLMANDDMEELAATGFYIDYDTRMLVSDTIHDIIQQMRNTYSEMTESGALDYYALGNGDFESGRAMAEQIKQDYYAELNFWNSLYYDKLWSEPLSRTLTTYNRYNTTYAQDDNGEWYATGIYRGLPSNPLFHIAPGSIDDPGGTAGYENDWKSVSAVTGQPMDQRALIPTEAGYLDTPDIDSLGDPDNDGWSSSWPGYSYSRSTDGDGDGTGGYGYGGSGGGYRRRRSGGGGGGGGYSPNIYSRLPNVYAPSARTMYAERVYGPNYDYLRPNFETKGSREAYKRSDI